MKTKHLLLAASMLLFTMLTATAQNATDKKPSSDAIPFGKKLPPPDIMKSADNSSGQVTQPSLNKLLMQAIKTHDKNAIKKTLDDYRQQLKDKNKQQALHVQGNNATPNSNQGSSNSNFHLVKDINALAESNPRSNPSLLTDIYWGGNNDSAAYAVLDNVAYFTADDGIHGSEFWRSDGTAAGTYMVKDIVPGLSTSSIYDITAVNGKIYFTNYSSGTSWVSDGTESGTQLLVGVGEPTGYFAMGKKTYFIADDDNNDFTTWAAIWETDGTTAGTKPLIHLGDKGTWISEPTAVNDLFFFTMFSYETSGWDLWRSDGTQTGTYSVASFPYGDTIPAQLTKYNNELYFSANDGTGRKLWVSDGAVAGTKQAPGNHNVLVDADILGTSFPILNNVLYIPGEKASKGNGLYKYDASNAAGLVKIKDFAPVGDTAFIVPLEMQVVNNRLYFKVTNYSGRMHDELWSSKGTNASTKPVYKLQPGETIKYLYNGCGICYFVKYDKLLGTELWRTYETSSGIFPLPVSDIFKGPTSSYPSYLTAFNGKLIFSATDEKKGNELFMTTNFGVGATLVKDINTVSTGSSFAGYYIDATTPLGNNVLFNAFEKQYGHELYKSDGTEHGTALLNDIIPGEDYFRAKQSNPYNFQSKNNAVYFIASDDYDLYSYYATRSIYKSDGTKVGLQKIAGGYSYVYDFKVADNGLVYFVLYNGGYQLWRSNGTAAGTILLSSTLYSSYSLNVTGNTAFFVAIDTVHGSELWKSNGSVAGTKMVKDINPGIGNSSPKGMFVYKNEVYFAADNGAGPSFWKSDGTKSGTRLLRQIDPWYSSVFSTDRYHFEISNNILYFAAIDYANSKGSKLWRTDGTVAGTYSVKDISPDADSFYPFPFYLTDVSGTLFFTTYTDNYMSGTELWKSDGTKEGTQLVKDVTSEADPSGLDNLIGFGGKLYFTKSGVLWSSDGTADGTMPVDDAGLSNVYVHNIVATSNQLFLSGFTQEYGMELYAGKVSETGKLVVSKTTNEDAVKTSLTFNATLYPNPVVNNATLQLTGNTNNVSVSVTDINGKTLWQSNINNSKFVRLPTEKYSPGIYFVTVTNGKESKTLKLVKQ